MPEWELYKKYYLFCNYRIIKLYYTIIILYYTSVKYVLLGMTQSGVPKTLLAVINSL